MLSGVENILYLKKIIQLSYFKQKNIINIFLYFFVIPIIFYIDFKLAYYIFLFEKNDIITNPEFSYYFVLIIFPMLFLGTAYFISSFKNYFHLRLYLLNIENAYVKNPKIFKQYVEQMSNRYLNQILNTLDIDDYNKFIYAKNNQDYFLQFFYIERFFDLYPNLNNLSNNYYLKSKKKYEQLDSIF